MPVYEYFCRACGTTFEKLYRRASIAETSTAACPAGHDGAARTLSLFATTGRATGVEDAVMGGGGCCGGGGCACSAGAFARN